MGVTISQLPSLLSQDEGTGTGSTFVFEVTRHLESVVSLHGAGVAFYYLPGFTWSISGQTTSDDFVGGMSGTVAEIQYSYFTPDAYSTHQFQVVSNGDGYGEDNESFSVNLSWLSYYFEYPSPYPSPYPSSPILVTSTNPLHVFSGVLVNDDLPAYLYIVAAGADKLEGTGVGVNWFDFNVTRSGELAIASTVNWAVEPIDLGFTADDISGLVLPSGTLVFSPGETQKTIQIPIFADNILEPDERFGIRLSSPSLGSLVSQGFATGIVRNDDSSVSISAGLAEAEGQDGLTELLYVVSRSGSLVEPCSVQWAVAGDSASPADGCDFRGSLFPSGTLNFAAGSASEVIRFYVKADTNAEPDENYKVTLANPIGTTLGTSGAIGAILDDDVAGRADRVLEGQPYLINISRYVSVEYGLSGAYRHYVPALTWSVTPRSAGLDDFSEIGRAHV